MELIQADTVTWEVEYTDGTIFRGLASGSYGRIDRDKLKSFSLIAREEKVLFTTWPPEGATGNNLVFRRRSTISNIGRSTIFVVGWAPLGPAFVFNLATGTYRVLDHGFDTADPELYPPAPMPGEPQQLVDCLRS